MINRETILHLADLARMKVSPQEADTLTKDLEGILAYVGALKSVDTKGILHDEEVGMHRNIWREDIATSDGDSQAIIAEAPESELGYVKVPKVLADS